ncbi:MAG: hypothetical protein J1F31_01910 [Erysipelotrichales bacterium]|nr:hypothetical protein [Erysipelotrichales bacterium]
MIIVSIIASILSIIFGTIVGLIDFDFSSLHLVILGIIWISTVFISYSISYLVGLIFKIKFKFFNLIPLIMSYTFSVVLVILISGSFDFLYVTSYLSVVTLIGIIYGIYKLYTARKKFYS